MYIGMWVDHMVEGIDPVTGNWFRGIINDWVEAWIEVDVYGMPTGIEVLNVYGSYDAADTLGWGAIFSSGGDGGYWDEGTYYTGWTEIPEENLIRTEEPDGTTTITIINDTQNDTEAAKDDGPAPNPNAINVYAPLPAANPAIEEITIVGKQAPSLDLDLTIGWLFTNDSGTGDAQETTYYTGSGAETDNDAQEDSQAIEVLQIYGHKPEPVLPELPLNLTALAPSVIDLDWDNTGAGSSNSDQAPDDVAQIEDEPPPLDDHSKNDATLAQNDDEDAPSDIEEIIITTHRIGPNDALQALIDDANDPRSFVEKVADTTTQMVGAAVDTVVETAAELGDAALQTVIDLIKNPSSLGQKVVNAATGTAEAINQVASASVDSVLNLDLGILKGLGNLPANAWNLAITTGKFLAGTLREASARDARAVDAYNNGDVEQANALAAEANQLRTKNLVSEPFTLNNTAQKAGSLVSAVVPLGSVVKAVGIVGKVALGADKLVDATKVVNEAADVAKVVDEVGDAAHALDVAESISSKVLTVEEAGANLAEQIGKNRVSVMTPSGRMQIDLAGKAHFEKSLGEEIPTPHVKFQDLNVAPNGQASLSPGITRAATMDDIRTAQKAIERRGN
ncbi:MAG: hypothetical protein LBF16_02665 [Pseudomonadales bacterium]|jgi:hypothetical protein|nr:hypothetical protein [Pseudomonadales bacterium]